jgi:PAS domain S-box-containing protein
MPVPLRLLILEDRSADAELMLYELRRAGLACDARRVDTEADYATALDPVLDLILADYTLPQFSALRALQLLQERALDIPFIIVTGSISEEIAVECMKQGAADYLLKDRLTRLGQAVTRALDQNRLRREKRQAEQALADNEKLFRALVENSSDVINLISANRTILYTSPAISHVLGYAIEEYVSHNTFEFLHPAEQRDIFSETALHAETPGQIATFTCRLRHKDGSWRWVEGVSQNLLHEPSVQAIVVNFRDVTERQQRERELEAIAVISEALRVADTRDDMLPIVVAQTLDILQVDGIALTMIDPATQETVISLAYGAWMDKTGVRLPAGAGISGQVIATGRLYVNNAAQSDFLWRDARSDFQAVACTPLTEQQHTIGALLIGRRTAGAAFTDHEVRLLGSIGEIAANALYRAEVLETLEKRIAERTQELIDANERLRELDRLKSKFVSDVSHELRTPVANLRLYIGLLEQGKPDKVAAYVATLRQQAKRLSTLVETILDLSRLERRKDPFTYEALHLNPIVEQVVIAHLPRVAATQVELAFRPGLDLPPVWGDANQLVQVMTNLVANALNYTPAGRIQITTYQTASRVCLEISDTGLGIQPDDLPHLFERFYRGQNVSRAGIAGTGLGLAIVKEIVDLHQGDIEVESEEGAGTTFRVCLPMAEPDRPPLSGE